MAFRILCTAARNLAIRNAAISNGFTTTFCKTESFQNQLLKVEAATIDNIRSIGFLNKISGADLWKSCASVSNAGKKRGRGRMAGKNLTKNLNMGQTIGEGRNRLVLPGLNAPVKQGTKVAKQEKGAPDPTWSEKLYSIRDMTRQRRRIKLTHLERGYSGTKMAGRSVGAPESSFGVNNLNEFDSRCIEMKLVVVMRGNLGRRRTHSSFVATGNENGVIGIGMGKSADPKSAMRKAKKRAAQKLMHVELCEGRTVYHDFFTQFGPTKIYVYKMPEGYGLKVHRVIKTLCNLIGIKDLRTKIEGSTNPTQIVKAFLVGLLQQKTYDQLAEEKQLYLVEFSSNYNYFPRIVGTPSYCRTAAEVPVDENRDFKQVVMGGKVPLKRFRAANPWEKLPSFERFRKKQEKKRSWPEQQLYLRAKYGKLASFLTEKHPEAIACDTRTY